MMTTIESKPISHDKNKKNIQIYTNQQTKL